MLQDNREVFARCCANPLQHPEQYEQTPVGLQQYKTHYALRRFQIDDATRKAVQCPCCLYVGMRHGVFTQSTNERFPPKLHQKKFVYRRPFTGAPPPGRGSHYFVYQCKRLARQTDVLLDDVCSQCINPMRGGNTPTVAQSPKTPP